MSAAAVRFGAGFMQYWRVVVLVEDDAVVAELVGQHHLRQVALVEVVADLGVVVGVREVDPQRRRTSCGPPAEPVYGKKWKKWNSASSTRPMCNPRQMCERCRMRPTPLRGAARGAGRPPPGASHSSRWPAPATTSIGAPPRPRRRGADREQLVLVAPQDEASGRRCGAAAPARPRSPSGHSEAGRRDVAQVAGDRSLVGAQLGEAIGERLRHALGEQMAHALGCRARRTGRGRGGRRRRCRTARAGPAP